MRKKTYPELINNTQKKKMLLLAVLAKNST